MELRYHTIRLYGQKCILRPLTESDWKVLVKWNNDSEVLYFSEGNDVSGYSMADVQGIYRGVSQRAYCFVIEHADSKYKDIGECWLQEMNLDRICAKYPGEDCRRIDLMIGEKAYWGQGIGTEVIRLLTAFAFEYEQADRLFGCDIADYNPRSLRAFQRNGFQIENRLVQSSEDPAQIRCNLSLPKEKYVIRKEKQNG